MKTELKLADMMCFPVYSLAKEIVNNYRPFLDNLELTYPQFLVMIVLWENGPQTVSEIGEKVHLDSGTLTPLLKRLEQKKFINRVRKNTDERVVQISVTKKGSRLKDKAAQVPVQLLDSLCVSIEDFVHLKASIENILAKANTQKIK